jgi:hypothetical protein
VADISELQVQLTLSIAELKEVVALVNLAAEHLGEGNEPDVVGVVSELYFELLEDLRQDGIFGHFQPE